MDGVSSYLKIDLAAVERVAVSLAALRGELDNAKDIANEGRTAVGSPVLGEALEDFATNWRRHRDRLVSSVDAVQAMAGQGAAAYRQVDGELTRALQGQGAAR